MSVTRDMYNGWAHIYEEDGNPMTAAEAGLYWQLMKNIDLADCQVLDLGCGTGRHTLLLSQQGSRVTAIDFSEGMLKQAMQKPGAENISFLLHDLSRDLPTEPGFFDLVVSSLVLEHIENLGHFFSQVAKVLKPGGRAILTTMHPNMFLKGTQARFTNPVTGEKVTATSYPYQISDFVNGAIESGLLLERLEEAKGSEELAQRLPRAEKYIGWNMLVALVCKKP